MNMINLGINLCRKLNIDLNKFNNKKMLVKYIKTLSFDNILE